MLSTILAASSFVSKYWKVFLGAAGVALLALFGRAKKRQGAVEREAELRVQNATNERKATANALEAKNRVDNADDAELERLRAKWERRGR